MDAISSLGIDWRALVAQAINFTILLLILRYFLYNPIVEMLENRRNKIAKGLEDAEQAQKQLEEADFEAKKKINQAQQRAQDIIKNAREESTKEASEIINQAKDKSKEIIDLAKNQSELEKQKIVDKAKSELGEIVLLATERIIEQKPEADEIEKILQKVAK